MGLQVFFVHVSTGLCLLFLVPVLLFPILMLEALGVSLYNLFSPMAMNSAPVGLTAAGSEQLHELYVRGEHYRSFLRSQMACLESLQEMLFTLSRGFCVGRFY